MTLQRRFVIFQHHFVIFQRHFVSFQRRFVTFQRHFVTLGAGLEPLRRERLKQLLVSLSSALLRLLGASA